MSVQKEKGLPTALIIGVAGQDGIYLARHLQSCGYRVAGMTELTEHSARQRVIDIVGDIPLMTGDITDIASLFKIIQAVEPDEIYNLAAVSSVRETWEQPIRSCAVNGLGMVNILETLRAIAGKRTSDVRVFQASSAQIFGDAVHGSFSEETPVRPSSPYGAAKALAHFTAAAYRQRHGMFVSCGILGNHESPLHSADFLIPRITLAASRIAAGTQEGLVLDNLTGTRDWGYAGDFVRAMHAALQHPEPEDFVIASGAAHTVAEAVTIAFAAAGIPDWKRYVSITGAATGQVLQGAPGDIAKARRLLGWAPTVGFEELITMMVAHHASSRELVDARAMLRHAGAGLLL